jgi:type I restriction enzyme S subunit
MSNGELIVRTSQDGAVDVAPRSAAKRQRPVCAQVAPALKAPRGWKTGTLADVIASVRGGFSVQCDDRAVLPSEVGVLKTSAVLSGTFDPIQNKYVPPEEHPRLRTPVSAGRIVFCRKNSEEAIGASALVKASYDNLFLSDLLWELTPSAGTSDRWLAQVMQSNHVKTYVRLWSTGTQSTMKNISQDRLLAIPVWIPPQSEQLAIATLLGTWDEADDILSSFIAARTKEYAHQSERFFAPCHPSFQDRGYGWHSFNLGTLFTERTEVGLDSDVLLSITMADGVISQEEVGRRDSSTEDKANYKLILPGDIGYNTMRMWQGVCGLSSLRGVVSPAYTVVTPIESRIHARYAFHLFKSKRMIHDFERYSQGLTSDTWNLKFPTFSEIRVCLPDLANQVCQANYLDAMQEELRILRRQAEALSAQKRGLMQKLVTGEWRVRP